MCIALRILIVAATVGIGVAHAESSVNTASPRNPVTIMKVLPAGDASPVPTRDPDQLLTGGTTGAAPKPVKTIKVAPADDAAPEGIQPRDR